MENYLCLYIFLDIAYYLFIMKKHLKTKENNSMLLYEKFLSYKANSILRNYN